MFENAGHQVTLHDLADWRTSGLGILTLLLAPVSGCCHPPNHST
jgi:hypothetical protein